MSQVGSIIREHEQLQPSKTDGEGDQTDNGYCSSHVYALSQYRGSDWVAASHDRRNIAITPITLRIGSYTPRIMSRLVTEARPEA